jgi:N-acyl homoserine lactone hydrolase
MNVTDPIRRVSIVSTGQVQIRPDHVESTWRPMAWWLLASRTWTGPRPPAHQRLCHRAPRRPGAVRHRAGPGLGLRSRLFPRRGDRDAVRSAGPVEIGSQQTLSAGLERVGYKAGDVTTAVVSHLHQDHIGGVAELSRADILVSQAEWDTPSRPMAAMRG